MLGGPLHALGHLVKVLRDQRAFAAIGAGGIVTTGTITDAHAVSPGQRWRSTYDGAPLAGITVEFIE